MRAAALFAGVVLVLGGAAAGSAAPRAGASDRTQKLDLIDRLTRAPETLIVGSSRSRQAEPSFLRSLTGRTGFNAGVTGGEASDAWVFTRYLADCFPRSRFRYLWFVDAGLATDGVNPELAADPRSGKYLDPAAGPAAASARKCGPGDRRAGSRYSPDGSLGPELTRNGGGRVPDFAEQVAKLVASVRANANVHSGELDSGRYVWFEKTLAFMKARGERSVIVFNPIYPAVLAALRRAGFPARKTSEAYLTKLHKRFDFVVVDAEDIRAWGGRAEDFSNPTHINRTNMRRLLRYVAAHSDGALR